MEIRFSSLRGSRLFHYNNIVEAQMKLPKKKEKKIAKFAFWKKYIFALPQQSDPVNNQWENHFHFCFSSVHVRSFGSKKFKNDLYRVRLHRSSSARGGSEEKKRKEKIKYKKETPSQSKRQNTADLLKLSESEKFKRRKWKALKNFHFSFYFIFHHKTEDKQQQRKRGSSRIDHDFGVCLSVAWHSPECVELFDEKRSRENEKLGFRWQWICVDAFFLFWKFTFLSLLYFFLFVFYQLHNWNLKSTSKTSYHWIGSRA